MRLFEAAACGTPIVSDRWAGLDTLLEAGEEIVLADDADAVVALLCALPETRRQDIAARARARVLSEHTAPRTGRKGWNAICWRHGGRRLGSASRPEVGCHPPSTGRYAAAFGAASRRTTPCYPSLRNGENQPHGCVRVVRLVAAPRHADAHPADTSRISRRCCCSRLAAFVLATIRTAPGTQPGLALLYGLVVGLNVAALTMSAWSTLLGAAVAPFARAGHSLGGPRLAPPTGRARTAILLPVYEEDAARVLATADAMAGSLAAERVGEIDVFVLSDSRSAGAIAAEEAMLALRRPQRPGRRCSIAGAPTTPGARPATSPSSASAGAPPTTSWWYSTPTA